MAKSNIDEKSIDDILAALDQFEQTLNVMSAMVSTVKENMVSEFSIENHIEDIAQFNLEQTLSPQNLVH
ncbi:MAG TPA: hypothetical protein VIM85_09365 [Pseudomonadales bacterium]